MKRNILKITFIAAVVVAAGYIAYSHFQKTETLSDLALQNVEALADDENDGGVAVSGCLGVWGKCTLPDGTKSLAPAVHVSF